MNVRAARGFVPGSAMPGVPGLLLERDLLAQAKALLFKHFEKVIVLALLASLLVINFFVVHKFAFLLFYFVPVLMAGFYLNTRGAIFTAFLSIGFVVYTTLVGAASAVPVSANVSFWNVFIWGCFLTLTGAIVGQLHEKNVAQVAQLRQAYLGIITILTKYLEAADAYTKSHSERVASISAVLAERLGLPPDQVQNIWTAALLHDIGKVEVVELIQKASELDPQEKAAVDSHTELGAQLLLTAGTVLQDAIPVVLNHHRPFQEGEGEIPIGARIVAVADAYDSIVSDRPYRAGRSHWQALEILQAGAGQQFDPQIVSAMELVESQVLGVYEGK